MESTPAATPGLPATQPEETALAYPQGVPAGPYAYMDDADSGDGLTISGLIHSLRRQLLPALGIGIVLSSLLAILLWFTIPTVFKTTAVLRVNRELSGGTAGDFMIYKETQGALLRSNLVIQAALRENDINQRGMVKTDRWGKPRVEQKKPAWLMGRIVVNNTEDELMFVHMSGRNQEDNEAILNGVVDAYVREIVGKEQLEKVALQRRLRQRYDRLYNQLKEKTDQINTLAQQTGASTTDSRMMQQQHQLKIQQMNKAQQDVDRLQILFNDAFDKAAMLNMQSRSGSGNPDENLIQAQFDKDRMYYDLGVDIDLYKEELERISQISKPGSREVEEISQAIARKERKRAEREQVLRPRAIAQLHHISGMSPSAIRSEFEMVKQQGRIYRKRLTQAAETFQLRLREVKDISGTTGEMEARLEDLMSLRHEVATIRKEMAGLDIQLDGPDRVSVVQPATTPNPSNWVAKVGQVAGGWLISLMGIIVAVSYWDYLSKKVNTSDDLNRTARVIGTLPALQQTGLLSFGRLGRDDMEAAMKVSIDGVRTAILYNRQAATQTVMVTSATGQEGRSTLASQLAVSMARAGKTTLLIDGDIHSPQQHTIFGVQPQGGLCEMLRGEQTSDEAIVATPVENVWLLSAGHCDQTALQGLAGDQAKAVFEDFKARFDYIIIDSSPVLTGAEALLLGQNVDSAILSVRRDISQMPKVNAANTRLGSVGIPVLGVVVNGAVAEMRKTDAPAQPVIDEEQPALTTA